LIVKMTGDDAVWHKAVRMPTFDGTTEGEFQTFWVRYRAYAEVHDFVQALVTDADMPSSSTATITVDDAGKLQKAAVKRNKIAMVNFTMAFTSEGTISFLYNKAETADWPNGLASLVKDALKAKYMPQDTVG
jgi:hypothetical protein